MKKLLLTLLLFVGLATNAQSTIFQDNFESYQDFAITGIGGWTMRDVDLLTTYVIGTTVFPNNGVPKAFQVFNGQTTTPPIATTTAQDWSGRGGSGKFMCCIAGQPAGTITANNDWMISPQMTLGTGNTVSFWAKACTTMYVAEKFSVWVSTTGTLPANFTKISAGAAITTPGIAYAQYSYPIPTTYNNLPVYIAIKCTSVDRFGFGVDDFKVVGTVPCPAPSAGIAVVNSTALTADLSWTAGGGSLNSELVYQPVGNGAPATAPGTGSVVGGTSTTVTGLDPDAAYEFYVRDECTAGTLYSVWAGPFYFNTFSVPNCATTVFPANGATNVPSGSTTLTWDAPTAGGPATSYDLYIDTTTATTFFANFTATDSGNTISLPNAFGTTYFWKVIAKNAGGSAVGCTNSSFTMQAAPAVPANDTCATAQTLTVGATINANPLNGTFFGATNATQTPTCELGGSASDVWYSVTVPASGSLTIETQLSPSQSSTDTTVVAFSGDCTTLAEEGCNADITTTNFLSSLALTGQVPGSILKIAVWKFGTAAARANDSKFIISAFDASLATSTFDNASFSAQPNPVKDILNLSYNKNITNVAVYNLLGQVVINKAVNNTESKIDMSELTSGAYMVKVTADNQVKTIKVIKE